MPKRNSTLTLIVHAAETPDDSKAVTLVQGEFGSVRILRRQSARDEVLPALWTPEARYSGIRRITSYVSSTVRIRKTLEAC